MHLAPATPAQTVLWACAHEVWHSLQICQEKMVGSLLYCRPFTVFVRPTIVETCRRAHPHELVYKLTHYMAAYVAIDIPIHHSLGNRS